METVRTLLNSKRREIEFILKKEVYFTCIEDLWKIPLEDITVVSCKEKSNES